MKQSQKKKNFYSIEGFDFDEAVKLHKLFGAPSPEFQLISDIDESCELFGTKQIKKQNTNIRCSQDITLHKKYELFIHNIIERQLSNDEEFFNLNSVVLEKVFDKEYKTMIIVLTKMGIIKSNNFYILDEKSYGYSLTEEYKDKVKYRTKPLYYPYRPYVKTLNRLLENKIAQEERSARMNLSNELYYNYKNSLNLLQISYPDEALSYTNTHFPTDNYSKQYYLNTINKYMEHSQHHIKVPNMQDNRIYHILTSTPRSLKYFLNIKYTIDIHNSHPLLFSKFLMDKYNIPINIRYILLSNIIYHYQLKHRNVRAKLCNALLENNINFPQIKNIPLDVIKYLYSTATGNFWDMVLSQQNNDNSNYCLLRQDVKVMMFAQVFYGKRISSYGQDYAKDFRKKFPNVYSAILDFKRGLKRHERTVLSHKLMALESELFRKALQRLYAMGYKVISIHDAIVVLDVKENGTCTPDIVKRVLSDVYKEHGLLPDCSVDYYGEREMLKFMAKEMRLRKLGDEYIAELRTKAQNDSNSQRILQDYDSGRAELILTPDQGSVRLHIKNTKDVMYLKRAHC